MTRAQNAQLAQACRLAVQHDRATAARYMREAGIPIFLALMLLAPRHPFRHFN